MTVKIHSRREPKLSTNAKIGQVGVVTPVSENASLRRGGRILVHIKDDFVVSGNAPLEAPRPQVVVHAIRIVIHGKPRFHREPDGFGQNAF